MTRVANYFKRLFETNRKKCYIVHSDSVGNFYVCKVLNRYASELEAIDGIVDLLEHRARENDLLREFSQIEDL